jgi:hypothetical protein
MSDRLRWLIDAILLAVLAATLLWLALRVARVILRV